MSVLHDTTEFSFTRNSPDGVGHLSYVKGRHRTHTACGLLMHSSLVLTTDGVPLGLAAVQFWSRKGFKGNNARKRMINPTTVPIEKKESYRWLKNMTRSTREIGDPGGCVHIGDRGGDNSSGAIETPHDRAADQPAGGAVCRRVAGVLAYDDETGHP